MSASTTSRKSITRYSRKFATEPEEQDHVLWELYDAEREAEEALEEAKRTERRRTVAIILAEPQPAGLNTEQALEGLGGVKRLVGAALRRKQAIEEEIQKQETESATLRLRVCAAQAAVIASEPEALERLWAYGERLRGCLQDWQATCEVIGLTRLPNGRWQHWHAVNLPGTPPAEPLAERWRETLEALDGADCNRALPLPSR